MKRTIFEGEIVELDAHVATIDMVIGVMAERIGNLERLRLRAVIVQRQMQDFCDMLDANEAASKSAEMDAAGTHPSSLTAN